jgi:hypothetical protein
VPSLLILLLVPLGGCHGAPPAGPALATSQDANAVRVALDGLAVIARPASDPSYRRSSFGEPWADTDHDGCSQRRDALAATVDRTRPFTEVRRGACAASVVAGTWTDPYTGQLLTFTDLTQTDQAQQIPIDHVVALALAYRYGASTWTAERRLAFATDLSNLQPTSRSSNLAKSDRDAAAWRPTAPFQCAYATRYVRVKATYALAVDRSEKMALVDMLTTCPSSAR